MSIPTNNYHPPHPVNFSCSTSIPLDIPPVHLITWAVFCTILSILSIISNTLLIYALYKTSQLSSATCKFLVAMGLSDLILGMVIFPMLNVIIVMQLNGETRNCNLEIVIRYFGMGSVYFSGIMLVSVAYDRYLHVSKMTRYKEFMNNFRVKIIIFASIVAANIPMVIALFIPGFYFQIIILTVDLIAMSCICVLYNSVLKKVRSHSLRLRSSSGSNLDVEPQKKRRAKQDLSVTKTVRTLFVLMIALYGPYHLVTTVQAYHEHFRPGKHGYRNLKFRLDIAEYWSIIMITSSSYVNATVFCLTNKRIRKLLKQICCCGENTIDGEQSDSCISKPIEMPVRSKMKSNPAYKEDSENSDCGISKPIEMPVSLEMNNTPVYQGNNGNSDSGISKPVEIPARSEMNNNPVYQGNNGNSDSGISKSIEMAVSLTMKNNLVYQEESGNSDSGISKPIEISNPVYNCSMDSE